MAERWFVAAGNWVAANFNGGTLPATDDDVYANGFAVTIDISITVKSLRTTAGTTAVAGGSFTTSGAVTVNADSYAGTTTCLNLAINSGSVQNGNSYGSDTTSNRFATLSNLTTVQNGNAYGGSAAAGIATGLSRGTFNGDGYGGSGSSNAVGVFSNTGGNFNGNSYGGTGSPGALIDYGCIQYGNAFGSTTDAFPGSRVMRGGILSGSATGGDVTGAHGAIVDLGGIFHGAATGSTTANARGVTCTQGGIAMVTLATGNAASREGVSGGASEFVEVLATSGTNPTAISGSRTDLPFFSAAAAAGFTGIVGVVRHLGT